MQIKLAAMYLKKITGTRTPREEGSRWRGNREFAQGRHLTTATRILQFVFSDEKLGSFLLKPQWGYKILIRKEK